MDRARRTSPSGSGASPRPTERPVGDPERRLEERERLVGERERQANEREREADEREREADEREERLEEYSPRLRQHAEELRTRVSSVCERAAEAVEQARTALEANQQRMRRAEAALHRAHASEARDQASAARLANLDEQQPAPRKRTFADVADGVSALREKTAAAAARLAETEKEAARIYDELAASKPRNSEYKRMAKEAREAMRRARETEQKYRS